jgi:hypothetical protein
MLPSEKGYFDTGLLTGGVVRQGKVLWFGGRFVNGSSAEKVTAQEVNHLKFHSLDNYVLITRKMDLYSIPVNIGAKTRN